MRKLALMFAVIMQIFFIIPLSAHAVTASELQVSPYKESDFDGKAASIAPISKKVSTKGSGFEMTITANEDFILDRSKFKVEVLQNGTWYVLPYSDQYAEIYKTGDDWINLPLNAKESQYEFLYFSEFEHTFELGNYRIIWTIDGKPYKVEFEAVQPSEISPPFPSPLAEEDFSENMTMSPEYPVYNKDISIIYIEVENNSDDEEVMFDEYYVIETKVEGHWLRLPYDINVDFNDIEIILSGKSSTYHQPIYLSIFDFEFIDGQYRVIKEIGGKAVSATFVLGESLISATTPYGYVDLADLPKNYDIETAKADSCVVITDDGVFNEERLVQFAKKALLNIPTMLRTLRAYGDRAPEIVDFIYESSSTFSVERFEVRRANAANPGAYKYGYYSYITTITRNGKDMVCLSNYAMPDRDAPENSAFMLLNPKGCPQEALSRVKESNAATLDSSYYSRISPNGHNSASLYNRVDEDRKKFGYSLPGMGSIVDVPSDTLKCLNSLRWLNNTQIELTGERDDASEFTIIYDTSKRDFI